LADLTTIVYGLVALSGATFFAVLTQAIAEAFLGLSVLERVSLGLCIFFLALAAIIAGIKAWMKRRATPLLRARMQHHNVGQWKRTLLTPASVIRESEGEFYDNKVYINRGEPAQQPAASRPLSSGILYGTHVRGESFRLVDLLISDYVIRGRTFENCTIYGPAIIAPRRVDFDHCTFDSDPDDPEQMLWLVPDDRDIVRGVIGIEDCSFRECIFPASG